VDKIFVGELNRAGERFSWSNGDMNNSNVQVEI
jgi:hypothetical protein